jgi:hypothetical protein
VSAANAFSSKAAVLRKAAFPVETAMPKEQGFKIGTRPARLLGSLFPCRRTPLPGGPLPSMGKGMGKGMGFGHAWRSPAAFSLVKQKLERDLPLGMSGRNKT